MTMGIGVVGLGQWGPNYVRVFGSLDASRVAAAADVNPDCGRRLGARLAGIEFVTDYRALLTRPDVDAVVVAAPTAAHAAIARDALEAGKHVLCEKPLTHSSREAWELVALARARNRVLMAGHVFLFNPGIEYLAAAARDEATGPIYYLSAVRTNLGPFRKDVNAAWDLASHDVYVFNHLLAARPERAAATGASYLRAGVHDLVFVTLFYPRGVVGHIHVSWLDPKKVRHLTLVGEKRMITWDEHGQPGPVLVLNRAVVREPVYSTFGEFQLLTREGDAMVPRISPIEPLVAQARAFLERCRQPDVADSRGSAVQAAETVDVLEAVSRSLAENGRAVEVRYGE